MSPTLPEAALLVGHSTLHPDPPDDKDGVTGTRSPTAVWHFLGAQKFSPHNRGSKIVCLWSERPTWRPQGVQQTAGETRCVHRAAALGAARGRGQLWMRRESSSAPGPPRGPSRRAVGPGGGEEEEGGCGGEQSELLSAKNILITVSQTEHFRARRRRRRDSPGTERPCPCSGRLSPHPACHPGTHGPPRRLGHAHPRPAFALGPQGFQGNIIRNKSSQPRKPALKGRRESKLLRHLKRSFKPDGGGRRRRTAERWPRRRDGGRPV